MQSARATLAAMATIGCSFMGSTLITPLYAPYRHAFGFSEITLTLIYAVYVVGNVVALFFFGRLSDSIGRRTVALPALGLIAGSMLIFLFAQSTTSLFAARALSGLGIGLATGTATAWLADLYTGDEKRATLLASGANAVGVAVGPLVAGAIAQYTNAPLRWPFIAYIPLLVAAAVLVARSTENVAERKAVSLRPRIGVPQEIRPKFVAPAIAAFGSFALIGYYASLIPTLLAQEMHETNDLVAGAIVSELFAAMAIVIAITRGLTSRCAMLGALWLLLPSVGLLLLAQSARSIELLLVAGACGGIAAGIGYRGSLQVVNEIAPSDRRAEVVSAYLIACFVGNSLPVIGIGFIAAASNSMTASLTFGATIAAFATVALFFEHLREARRPQGRPRTERSFFG